MSSETPTLAERGSCARLRHQSPLTATLFF